MKTVGSILVLCEQPVVAALVGMLIESAGRQPVFLAQDEAASDAIQRLRPLAVILIDAETNAAQSDLFFALVSRWQIGVVVFGSEQKARQIAEVAAYRHIPWITLPADVERLKLAIELAAGGKKDDRLQQRRNPAVANLSRDGTRLLCDGHGRNWMVYDRRTTSERRLGEGLETTDRVFVAENGETRHFLAGGLELDASSPSELEEQLARATE